MWEPKITNISSLNVTNTSTLYGHLNSSFVSLHCFNSTCNDVTSGSLAAKSLVCNGTIVTLDTFKTKLTFQVNESCVNVNVSVVPGRVYSHPEPSPLALSFLEANYYVIGSNTFAVVTNDQGTTVGQIQSDLIQVNIQYYSENHVVVTVLPCILFDESINSTKYGVFDIGKLMNDGVTIHPLGLTNTHNLSDVGGVKICFSKISLSNSMTSLILIK